MVNYRDEYGGGTWNHPLIGAETRARVDVLDEIGRDRFIVGTPEQCISQDPALPRDGRRGPSDLPAVLPRHAPRAHHGRATAAGERSDAGFQGVV